MPIYTTALTEIHFRADVQSIVEACSGYANGFGKSGVIYKEY